MSKYTVKGFYEPADGTVGFKPCPDAMATWYFVIDGQQRVAGFPTRPDAEQWIAEEENKVSATEVESKQDATFEAPAARPKFADTKTIVITGSIGDGFKFHGPFDGYLAASSWAELHKSESWEIVPLNKPEQ